MMDSPLLMVANWDWVLYNFRLPLVRALEARGLEVVLVCPPGEYTGRLQEMGFQWQAWQLERRSTCAGRELLAVLRLFRIYRQRRPRAVHHITIKPILYGSMAALAGGPATVINNFTGLGYLFSDQPGARSLRRWTLPLLRRVLTRPGSHTVLLNEGDRRRLASQGLIVPQRTTVIPGDGVDLQRFAPPGEAGARGDPPVVLMAARLLRDKGVREYLEAARRILDRDIPARFWLAGEPDPGNPASLAWDEVEEAARRDGIEVLGQRQDMHELLREASLAVLPSYHEGLPMFLLEAAAAGLPLVGSDIPGCRQVIDEGVNGYLVPPGDAEALADKIHKLLADRALREEMGRISRARAEEKFDQEKIIQEYLSLYQELGLLPA